jgi:hypothetical protein
MGNKAIPNWQLDSTREFQTGFNPLTGVFIPESFEEHKDTPLKRKRIFWFNRNRNSLTYPRI